MGRFDLDPDRLNVRTLLEFADAAKRLGAEVDIARWLFASYVSGIEVTQGIQYFHAAQHLTDAADRGADNAVRLVAHKPAWVRVYVRAGVLGDGQDLTGEVVVEHRTNYFLTTEWAVVATLSPQWPAVVTSQQSPAYATERGTIGSTLNFIVGGNLMEGLVRLTARIWRSGDAARKVLDTWQETVDATMLQTLSLRGIFIHYKGRNAADTADLDLAAPTVADLQTTAAWTLTTMPVESTGIFSGGGSMNWFVPLTGPATSPGGCSSEWESLTYWLSLLKNNDGNRDDVIYYGLLPKGTPVGPVTGCELYGVSAGSDRDGVSMAHEVGHGAGLGHGPCGTTGGVDANYPAYEPYDPANTPTASLGEYGLDVTNGTIHGPSEKDLMSYCGPRWISLYHHARLTWNAKFNPRGIGVSRWRPPVLVDPYLWPWEYIPDPPSWERGPGDVRAKAENLIAILGVVDEMRRLDVRSVTRIQALRHTRDAAATPWLAQLVGANGEVVATAPVMRLRAHGSGCGCKGGGDRDDGPFVIEAMLSDVEPGTELRIVRRPDETRGAEPVWSRRAPSRRPRVGRVAVAVARGQVTATWEASAARDCVPEFALQFSKDDGRSWNGITVGLTEPRHRFPVSTLPSGRLIFRVLAHDGFHTATAVSRPVDVPSRAPVASILSPQDGRPYVAGLPLRLWAAVTTDDATPVDQDACTWTMDDEGVARGTDTFVAAPAAGDHRCTLAVRSRAGTSLVTVQFRTVDASETDPERFGPSAGSDGGAPTARGGRGAPSRTRRRRATRR